MPPVNKANAADDFQYEYITNEDYAETGAYSTDEYSHISKSFQWTISVPDTSVYSGLASSRTNALAIANLSNAESVEVSDGTYKKPDGRVCIGMYQPVVMLPDLDSQENLDVSTNLLVTTGAPPAGTFPFQKLGDPASLVPEIGWKAIYSPMKETGGLWPLINHVCRAMELCFQIPVGHNTVMFFQDICQDLLIYYKTYHKK